MNVWIITTGSSDVQLKTDGHWGPLCDKAKQHKDDDKKLKFSFKLDLTKSVVKPKSSDLITRYLAPARAMGIVYGNAIATDPKYYQDLDFPLLNNFSTLLEDKKIVFDRIIVLVTDQANLFQLSDYTNKIYCPYWQDTCTLKDILKQYFQTFTQKKGEVEPEFVELKPKAKTSDNASEKALGLDDWNNVLKLVQKKFADLNDILENATVYVSHQAGTPAISSAVQFVSLARFGKKVKFLVSNEYENQPLDPIDSSEYLKGIKFQEAKALLKRYDYSGVKELLESYLEPEAKILLEAAIQWNFAKFDDFATKLLNYSDSNFVKEVQERTKKENWWWIAYESAYLAVVRLDQENTVEAMFHSFRAVEGLLRKWADEKHKPSQNNHLEQIQIVSNGKTTKFSRYGKALYNCLAKCRDIDSTNNEDIWQFGNVTFDKRNNLFHQLLGMQKEQVFQDWVTENPEAWKARILGCLNFIIREDVSQEFRSLEEASLMHKVHKKLKKAIAP